MNYFSRPLALLIACTLAIPMLAAPPAKAEGTKEKNSASDKEAAKALEAAAQKRTPKEIEIPLPWAPSAAPLNKPQAIKRFGRLVINSIWDNLEMLCHECVKGGDTELYAMAKFYLAVLAGRDIINTVDREKAKKEVFAMVDEAIELGFRNAFLIEQSKPLFPLHDLPEFREKIKSLIIAVVQMATAQNHYRSQTRPSVALRNLEARIGCRLMSPPALMERSWWFGRTRKVAWVIACCRMAGKVVSRCRMVWLRVASRSPANLRQVSHWPSIRIRKASG